MEREIYQLQKDINCEASTVWMIEDDIIYPYILFGDNVDAIRDLELKKDQGLCGICISKNIEIISNDLTKEPSWYSKADDTSGFVSRNIICLPIEVLGEVYGCVQLLNKRDGDFTEEDIAICREIVSLVTEKL